MSEKARWVIACDGARSRVRQSLGIQLDDLQFEEPWLVVDAEVDGDVQFPKLTGVPDEADLQQMSVMMCDPKRPMTIVPGRGNHRRWEMMLLPGEDDQMMMQADKVAELVRPYLNGVPHHIVRAATYRFHGLIAAQWKIGQVFLAGDAAHQTPPFFGQGMCHGLRDVANLVWKMSAIQRGLADETLLETYQLERDSHVRSVISSAVEAGQYICILDEQKAAERDAVIRKKAFLNELPGTAAELIPAIRAGVIAEETVKAGARFIQPRMNGRLMDDVIGGDWKLFVTGEAAFTAAKTFIDKSMPDYCMSITDVTSLEEGHALSTGYKE
ncbi:FAD-dependent monooxygenase [Vibrio sp. PP-XX7]